jgi:hypothetical protein
MTMVIVTIINWEKKLLISLVCVLILVGILVGFNSCFLREANPFVAPSGKLEDDILKQSVKVQGEVDS